MVWISSVASFFLTYSWSDVGLYAKDRLDPHSDGFLKFCSPVQVAMVGHRHRVHSKLFDLVQQTIHAVAAVQEGVFRMKVQVGELGHAKHDGTRRN